MTGRRRTPEEERTKQAVSDLEDPTAAFPIGMLAKASRKKKQKKAQSGPKTADEWLDEDEQATAEAPLQLDDYDDYEDAPVPRYQVTVDGRLVALWFAAAAVLGLLAFLAGLAALLF